MLNILNIIKEHYKTVNVLSPLKATYCNLSGEDIKNNEYIRYETGETYLIKYLEKYINFISKSSSNMSYEDNKINIEYNNILISFDLTFKKSFHSYVNHPYSNEVSKYLIYGTYSEIENTKPYFKKNDLKSIKKYFKHGDIVSTGDQYFIMKNEKLKKRTWKKIDLYFDNSLFIDYNYVQSRGYLYYIGLRKFFDINVLPLDNKNDEMYNIESSYLFESNSDQYTDDILDEKCNTFLDINEDENKEYNDQKKLLNREYGKIIMKDNDFYIKFDDTNHIKIEENIARQFIYIRGHVYYHNISQEFEKEWKCLISPFEVLNFYNGKINKIKL